MATVIDDVTAKAILARLDALSLDVARIAEKQRATEELFEEFTPIAKEVLATATQRFDELEKKGWFAFGKEALGVAERVVEGFQPADVKQLGDAVVGILDTVRALTHPDVLAVAGEVSKVLQHVDDAEPIGILGMVRATRNDEVQRGMAVMLEVLRHVGRAASHAARARRNSPFAPKRARLMLPAASVTAAVEVRAKPAVACATPREPQPAATVIDGIAFSADGHLVDPSQWTRGLGENLARLQGLELTDAHWKVIDFARNEFLETKASPNIRRITQALGITTKELYALFPKAPGRTVAKLAGIPKPVGCL